MDSKEKIDVLLDVGEMTATSVMNKVKNIARLSVGLVVCFFDSELGADIIDNKND